MKPAEALPDWPKEGERYVCSAEKPMPRPCPADTIWLHPDAKDAGTCIEGCCDRYECPHCGQRWMNESAQ